MTAAERKQCHNPLFPKLKTVLALKNYGGKALRQLNTVQHSR